MQLKQSSHISYYYIKWEGKPSNNEGHGDPDAIASPASHAVDSTGTGIAGDIGGPPAIYRPRHIFWLLWKQEKQ